MRTVIIFALCLVLSAWARDYYDTKTLKLDAADIAIMEMETGAGFLHINGTNNKDKITVTAEIEISDIDNDEVKRVLERELELTLHQAGDRAILKSHFHGSSWFSGSFRSAHVNLTVEVPKNIQLYIDDGSGHIKVNEMNARVEIDDGSGTLEINSISGDVEIHDGSADIEIKNITGNLRIEDNSGGIDVADIVGDIDIDDGSGSITVRKVDGNVTIRDGSGSIDVEDVEKNVIIAEDGSGSVYISDVRGTVKRYDDD